MLAVLALHNPCHAWRLCIAMSYPSVLRHALLQSIAVLQCSASAYLACLVCSFRSLCLWHCFTHQHCLVIMQAEVHSLRAANSELQRKLELQTQRLELAIQQQAHASPHAFSPSTTALLPAIRSGIQTEQLQVIQPQLQVTQPQLQSESQAASSALSAGQEQQHTQHVAASVQQQSEAEMQKQSTDQQQWQSPLYHATHVHSAPPTPQQTARRPLRAPSGMFTLDISIFVQIASIVSAESHLA